MAVCRGTGSREDHLLELAEMSGTLSFDEVEEIKDFGFAFEKAEIVFIF